MNAVKEQIRIRVKGFGWSDLHHPWSEGGKDHSPDILLKHLIEKIIPQQNKRGIPKEPMMTLPSRKQTPQLGTRTSDIDKLDAHYDNEMNHAICEAKKLREHLEESGIADRHEKFQPSISPAVDEGLIGKEIEVLYSYNEPDGSKVDQWCQGLVVAVKSQNRVHVQWCESTLREGDIPITEEVLMKSKWNRHVLGGWRFSIDSLSS